MNVNENESEWRYYIVSIQRTVPKPVCFSQIRALYLQSEAKIHVNDWVESSHFKENFPSSWDTTVTEISEQYFQELRNERVEFRDWMNSPATTPDYDH